MKWESEEGQRVLGAKYSIQTNGSNPVNDTRKYLNELIFGDRASKGRIGREYVGGEKKYRYYLEEDGLEVKAVESVRMVSTGRKAIDAEKIAEIRKMRLEGHTVREIASVLKVGRGTVAKYMK